LASFLSKSQVLQAHWQLSNAKIK